MISKRKVQPHDMLNHSLDIQLCELVSQNPCLYDPSLPEYKEAVLRERAWEHIAADINVPIDMCKSRWRNIRDCYRRNKKWRMFGSKGDFSAKPRKVYVLNEYLEFLDIIGDDEKRSNFLPQQDILDGENMVPNIEIILDAAKSVNELGHEFKQEREEDNDDEFEKEEEEEEDIERDESQNICSMFNASDAFTSSVTSTCNFGTVQTDDVKTNSVEFTSSRKRKAAVNKVMSRKLYKKAPKKARNRFEQNKNLQHSKRQYPIDTKQSPENVNYNEDDTHLFFRSMAMTSKTFHPVILAELKKKICAIVMDTILENEKLSGVYSNVYHPSRRLSYSPSPPFTLHNKDDESEVT